MPGAAKYRIITRGATHPGCDVSHVKRQFSERFRLSADLTDKLFTGERVCLKSNLDARTAQAYVEHLTEIGLVADLEAMPGNSDLESSYEVLKLEEAPPRKANIEPGSIVCPACGSYQGTAAKCIYCGLTFDPPPARPDMPARKLPRRTRQIPRSFHDAVATAPRYPLSGSGPYIIAGGALFLLLASAVLWIPILGLLFGLVTIGYLSSYMLEIVRSSALGKPTPPDWPEFQHWGHIFMPLLYVAGTLSLSFLPALMYYGLFLSWPAKPDFAFWSLSALGVFYFPMALLAVALTRLFRAASPQFVIPSIFRVWRHYLLACAVMALAYICSFVSREFAGDSVPLLGALVGNALGIYFMLLEMHIVGILFYTHEEELNWFE